MAIAGWQINRNISVQFHGKDDRATFLKKIVEEGSFSIDMARESPVSGRLAE
jgi:hypothetical protein